MKDTLKQPPAQRNEEPGNGFQQLQTYDEGYGPSDGYQQPGYGPPHLNPFYPDFQEAQRQQYWYPQPSSVPEEANPLERTSTGIQARTAGVLCYLFAWVGGLVFFLLERDNRFVRFHAIQSILFFGTMSILAWVFSFFPFALFGLGGVVGLVSFLGWILLMVAAYRGRYYKLPLLGDYAEQWAKRSNM